MLIAKIMIIPMILAVLFAALVFRFYRKGFKQRVRTEAAVLRDQLHYLDINDPDYIHKARELLLRLARLDRMENGDD